MDNLNDEKNSGLFNSAQGKDIHVAHGIHQWHSLAMSIFEHTRYSLPVSVSLDSNHYQEAICQKIIPAISVGSSQV